MSLNFLAVFVAIEDVLNTFARIQNAADRSVVIQSVDQKCDIFAHITVDIVRFRQKIWRLVDQVGCQDTVDDTILVRLIKLIHTVREQTECSGSENTFRFALFQLFGNIKDTFSGRDHIVDDDHIFSIYGSSEEFVGNRSGFFR